MTTDDADHLTTLHSYSSGSEASVLAEARALADEAEAKAKEVAALMARLARILERDDAEP